MTILILCTGNSCRSQMAEGFLKAFDQNMKVYSAGTAPSKRVHPKAIEVMNELGIDLSQNKPELVDQYLEMEFDHVITVCGGARDSCPVFTGAVKNEIHIGFDDPDRVEGSPDEILAEFVRIRNEILVDFFRFFHTSIVQ